MSLEIATNGKSPMGIEQGLSMDPERQYTGIVAKNSSYVNFQQGSYTQNQMMDKGQRIYLVGFNEHSLLALNGRYAEKSARQSVMVVVLKNNSYSIKYIGIIPYIYTHIPK